MIFMHLAPKKQRLFVTLALTLFIFGRAAAPCFGSDSGLLPSRGMQPADIAAAGTTAVPVSIRCEEAGFQLYRAGEPYYIKGIGGQKHLAMAADAGANSIRTWNARQAGSILDRAQGLDMTVMVGIWLSHDPRITGIRLPATQTGRPEPAAGGAPQPSGTAHVGPGQRDQSAGRRYPRAGGLSMNWPN